MDNKKFLTNFGLKNDLFYKTFLFNLKIVICILSLQIKVLNFKSNKKSLSSKN